MSLTYLVVVPVLSSNNIALRQMKNSSEENQPGGDIHHPIRMTIKLFICMLVGF